MDDRLERYRRLASTGILQELLGYSAAEAVRAAGQLSELAHRELSAAANEPFRNRGVLRALAAVELPMPERPPKAYPLFAEPGTAWGKSDQLTIA